MLPRLVIVTPALADANNGNWQTAQRWARCLAGAFRVRLVKHWPDAEAAHDQAMIALHARRSAPSIDAWHTLRGSAGLGVVLTGTDLYRDIHADTEAQRSLAQARTLVVLQALGTSALAAEHRPKARIIIQSCPTRKVLPKTERHLRAVMVGHLRPEKSPETLFAVAGLLAERNDIRLDHIGGILDPKLGKLAQQTQARFPHYRWLGPLPHRACRDRIQRAHLLVHCSHIEGGAHVIMEAVTSGTPVLASHIDGNAGMLGADYAGYFPCGDAKALASRLAACRDSQTDPQGLLQRIVQQSHIRSAVFSREAECAAVRRLAQDLLPGGTTLR